MTTPHDRSAAATLPEDADGNTNATGAQVTGQNSTTELPTESMDETMEDSEKVVDIQQSASSSPPSGASKTKTAVLEQDDGDNDDESDDTSDPFAAFNRGHTRTNNAKKVGRSGKSLLQIRIKSSVSNLLKGQVSSDSDDAAKEKNAGGDIANPNIALDTDDYNPSEPNETALDMANMLAGLDFDLAEEEERELEDSLRFFEEPHEDQDPENQKFEQEQKRTRILADLQKLDDEEKAGRLEIDRFVSEQHNERRASTERSVERYKKNKIDDEEPKELEKLKQLFKEKINHSQSKIHQGMQVLRKRHADDSQRLVQQHRQNMQRRNMSEQVANAEWAQLSHQLRQKHQNQMTEFARKGEELKLKTEEDYNSQVTKIKKKYEARLRDVEHNRLSINARLFAGFQQMRSRYLKRYSHGIAKRREALQRELTLLDDSQDDEEQAKVDDHEKGKNEKEVKPSLRPPSPLKSCGSCFTESSHALSGAALRHKHRKGVLSQIPKQLSVEIHNEGVWVSKMSEKKGDEKKEDDESEKRHFIPWGCKARELLHSIVCGEIPLFFESDKFQLGDTVAMNGGHIRCVMTDLRTSDETASAQRADSVLEQHAAVVRKMETEKAELIRNIDIVEKDIDTLNRQRGELEAKMASNNKDLEKSRSNLMAVREKYAKYFDAGKFIFLYHQLHSRAFLLTLFILRYFAGGNIIKGPQGEKFKAGYDKYEGAVDTYQKRALVIQTKIGEAKIALQKKHSIVKQAQRNVTVLASTIKKRHQVFHQVKTGELKLHQLEGRESFSARVKWHTAALDATAEKRQAELTHKRNGNSSKAWDQTLPRLSPMLKRSLYFKMHRRRQQIVLRPSFTSTVADLRQLVEKKHQERNKGRFISNEALEADIQAAEQKYLLATHTIAMKGEKVSSVPNVNGWAEPGMYFDSEASPSLDLAPE
jgi:hypothetical protein